MPPGVGWVYQYALKGENLSLAELRSLQDWVMRLAMQAAPTAYPKWPASAASSSNTRSLSTQYRISSINVTLSEIGDAVAASNMDTDWSRWSCPSSSSSSRRGYRHRRYWKWCRSADGGVRCCCAMSRVEIVPDEREGIAELDGEEGRCRRGGAATGGSQRAGRNRQRQGRD